MPPKKDIGLDIAYIAPCDPEKISVKERVQNAKNVQHAMNEIHKIFSNYESNIFMSALINCATIGAVAVGMEIQDLLRFTATCYQNAQNCQEIGVDKQ